MPLGVMGSESSTELVLWNVCYCVTTLTSLMFNYSCNVNYRLVSHLLLVHFVLLKELKAKMEELLSHGVRSGIMTSLCLDPPESFDFKSPDVWLKWKRRFKQYRQASGLSEEPAARQVSTLLYCLGEQANDVLTSTGISDAQRKVYNQVIAKFDEFFKI